MLEESSLYWAMREGMKTKLFEKFAFISSKTSGLFFFFHFDWGGHINTYFLYSQLSWLHTDSNLIFDLMYLYSIAVVGTVRGSSTALQ